MHEHEVEQDLPGKRLRLVRPATGNLGMRILCTLLLAPLLFSSLSALFGGLASGELPGVLLALPCSSVFGGMALAFAWAFGRGMGAWTALDFDLERGTLTLTYSGMLLWFPWRRTVPLDRLRVLRFEAGAEGGGQALPLTWHLGWVDERGREERVVIHLAVRDLDRRPEAMDLVFRVARVAGWPGWLCHRSDPRRLDLELVRKGKARRVPEVTEPVDYDTDGAVERHREPELQVAAFDPGVLREGSAYSVVVWAPGERVRLVVPPIGASQLLGSAAFGAVLGGLTGWLLMAQLEASALVLALTLPGGAALVSLAFWANWEEREVDFDWAGRRALFRSGKEVRELALDEVEGLVLRGHRATRQSSSGSGSHRTHHTYSVYWCALEAVVPGRDPLIHRTPEAREDPERPYQAMLPMAVELARALNVPWRWEEYS